MLKDMWSGNSTLSVAFWGVFIPTIIVTRLLDPLWESHPQLLAGLMGLACSLAVAFSIVVVWRHSKSPRASESPFPLIARIIVAVIGVPYLVIYALFGALGVFL